MIKKIKCLLLATALFPLCSFATTYKCPTLPNLEFKAAWMYGGPSSPFQYPMVACVYANSKGQQKVCGGSPNSFDNKFTPVSAQWKQDICNDNPANCLFSNTDQNIKYSADVGVPNCKFDQVG